MCFYAYRPQMVREKMSVQLFKCKTSWFKDKEMQFNLGEMHCCTQLEIPTLTKEIWLFMNFMQDLQAIKDQTST